MEPRDFNEVNFGLQIGTKRIPDGALTPKTRSIPLIISNQNVQSTFGPQEP
jgi:hypothetical protein